MAGTCRRQGTRGRRRNAPHLHRGVGSGRPGGSRLRGLSAAGSRRRGRLVQRRRRRRSLLPGGHDPFPADGARPAARRLRAAWRRGRAAASGARCAAGGGGPSRCRPGFLGGIPPTRNRAGNPLSREPGLSVRSGGSERVCESPPLPPQAAVGAAPLVPALASAATQQPERGGAASRARAAVGAGNGRAAAC